jgi:aminomethyltransferase
MKRTPLYDQHVSLGAKMTEFGGFEMPLQYTGITHEHLAVRESVGLFDVSHMGEFLISGDEAIPFVNRLVTNTVTSDLSKVTYALMTDHQGGVVDDLLVYVMKPDLVMLVVNAGNIDKDFNWVSENLGPEAVIVENKSKDFAQIAIQGPRTDEIIAFLLSIDQPTLEFMTYKIVETHGHHVILSKTGYTGEGGYEIYGEPEIITALFEKAITLGATPCGLGARDTLRFEANLPLYGHEISEQINPIEAGLKFAVKTDKDFIGRDALIETLNHQTKKIVGLELLEKGIPRHGYPVFAGDDPVGIITTGYMLPTQDKPIALALVDIEHSRIGTELTVEIRQKRVNARVRNRKFHQKKTKKQEASS